MNIQDATAGQNLRRYADEATARVLSTAKASNGKWLALLEVAGVAELYSDLSQWEPYFDLSDEGLEESYRRCRGSESVWDLIRKVRDEAQKPAFKLPRLMFYGKEVVPAIKGLLCRAPITPPQSDSPND